MCFISLTKEVLFEKSFSSRQLGGLYNVFSQIMVILVSTTNTGKHDISEGPMKYSKNYCYNKQKLMNERSESRKLR